MILTNRRFQLMIFSTLAVAASLYGTWFYRYSHDTERLGYENLPADGVADNDTKGLTPGNPENGLRALRNFHKFSLIYKSRHGTLPPQAPDLYHDIIADPTAYNVDSFREAVSLMHNADNRFSDKKFERLTANAVTLEGEATRPDGTKIFGPKQTGTKDVLAYSDTYVHQNIRTFPGERSTSNPVGFYQVLWDDGSVEQIPYDQIRYVLREQRKSFHSYKVGFPGQAGVPANALSYDEYYRSVGYAKGPRGGPGKPGLDYNGKPIGKS